MRAALDCETFRIASGRRAPRLVSVAFGTSVEVPRLYHRNDCRDGWLPELMHVLRNADEVVNHSLAYDLAVLLTELRRLVQLGRMSRPVYREIVRLVWALYDDDRARCTFVIAILLGIAKGEPATYGNRKRKGLHGWSMADCCAAILGEQPVGKTGPNVWRLQYHLLDDVPIADWPAAAVEYASLDPGWADRLYLAQREYVNGARMRGEVRHIRIAWCQQLAEAWGVRTDAEVVTALQQYLEREIRQGWAKIRAVIGRDGWLRDDGSRDMKRLHARVQSVLTSAGQWDPTPGRACVTSKGNVRADRQMQERCAKLGAEDLGVLASIGAHLTDRNNFAKTLASGVALPINARWFPVVESGRLACDSPNLTNQPTREVTFEQNGRKRTIGVRHGFVPRAGWLYIATDYSTAELRAFAQTAYEWFGFSAMRDALLAEAAALARGERALDLHCKFAARILGIDEATAIERHYGGDKVFGKARDLAKRINFGCLGMMGAATFLKTCIANSFDITLGGTLGDRAEVVAERLLAIWHETWPEVPVYFARVLGWLREAGGHAFRVVSTGDGIVRGNVGAADGANHFFQNRVARWLKDAWYRLAREAYVDEASPYHGCRIVIAPHDELIAEAPAHRAHPAAVRQALVMKEVAEADCPGMPIVVEPAAMRKWYKGAKPLYNAQGELIPWEPPKQNAA